MKPTSYPKIFNLGHNAIASLFNEPVLVEEKVDGSQFSFGVDSDGTLGMKSKGAVLYPPITDKLFRAACEYVQSIKALLKLGYQYRGEVLHSEQHNIIRYGRVPKHNLVLFDVEVGEQKYLSYEEKAEEAARLDLEVVPSLGVLKIDDYQTLKEQLARFSFLSTDERQVVVEGLVFKNYSRFGIDGKVLMGKWVREEFKELNSGGWKKANPTKQDIIQELISVYKTETRWKKALQHLRDNGQITNSPQDIGPLLKEVGLDVLAEEKEAISKTLFEHAWKQIGRGITAGLPEWYKQELAKSMFEETQ